MSAEDSSSFSFSEPGNEPTSEQVTSAIRLLNSLGDHDLRTVPLQRRLECVLHAAEILFHVAQQVPDDFMKLNSRAREVFELLLAGLCVEDIARQLGITESGVRWHIRTIIKAYDTNSYRKAVAMAKRRNPGEEA